MFPRQVTGLNKRSYTTSMLDLYALRSYFDGILYDVVNNWQIKDDEIEALYDWMVTEGFYRSVLSFNHCKIVGHHLHDVYRCVFDVYGQAFIETIHSVLMHNRIYFDPGAEIKVMVVGSTMFAAKKI